MNIGTFSLLAIYFALIFFILAFLVIFVLHIKPLQKYNPHIIVIQKITFAILTIIAILGAVGIIFGKEFQFPENAFDISVHNRLDF